MSEQAKSYQILSNLHHKIGEETQEKRWVLAKKGHWTNQKDTRKN